MLIYFVIGGLLLLAFGLVGWFTFVIHRANTNFERTLASIQPASRMCFVCEHVNPIARNSCENCGRIL